MNKIFKSGRFKIVLIVLGLLLLGMLLAAVNGHGETAQSGVIGTVFAPAHWVSDKISAGIDKVSSNAKGNTEYEDTIDSLQKEIGELQDQLTDYENLKAQNELYKNALELKENNPDFKYIGASVIARDSADVYCSFTISKGTVSGVKEGDAVLYGSYLIGTIKKAYPTYSIVTSILNPSFSVSAYDIASGEVSYVTGDAVLAPDGTCKMANLDSDTSIVYGSIISTAGISSTIPKGIVIGTVGEISDAKTDISTYAVINPGCSVNEVTECLVLTGYDNKGGGN